MEQKIIPFSANVFLKVVATETESITISTATPSITSRNVNPTSEIVTPTRRTLVESEVCMPVCVPMCSVCDDDDDDNDKKSETYQYR